MVTQYGVCCCSPFFVYHFSAKVQKWLEGISRARMGHMLGSKSYVSIPALVRLLLAMAMEIWDDECGPSRPNSASFAILGQVGNAIPPWNKGPSQEERAILLAHDQGLIALHVKGNFYTRNSSHDKMLRCVSFAQWPENGAENFAPSRIVHCTGHCTGRNIFGKKNPSPGLCIGTSNPKYVHFFGRLSGVYAAHKHNASRGLSYLSGIHPH